MFDYRIVTTATLKKLYEDYKVPMYWFLVDMKPMTGGCSYAMECNSYQFNCENCPAIINNYAKKFAVKTLNGKITNIKDIDLQIGTFY